MSATLVEVDALLQVIWVSLVAGVGMTAVFSLAILGAARASTERRAGRAGLAGAYGLLAVACGAVVAATVVLAVVVMLDKG